MKAFEKETQSYTFIIPKLQELRISNNLKPLTFPKCFYASVDEQLIILENLKSKNYKVTPKKPEREYRMTDLNKTVTSNEKRCFV